MNITDYKAKIASIEERARKEKIRADREYALGNNDVSVGDFVVDYNGVVLVEEIRFSITHNSAPYCVYFGTEYTKKMKPRKDGSKRSVHQVNLIKD